MTTALNTDRNAFGALETPEPLPSPEIEARARALLDQLDLDEKITLMYGDVSFWSGLVEMISKPKEFWVAGTVPRLGLSGIRFSDGPRGVCLEGATTFPVAMARGATWDLDLEERVGDVIGQELRALGGNLFGGVCINLLRHPAWGRAQETYGEDPWLLGEMGAALTRGVQQHTMACVKHYALNSMENARFTVDVTVDERTLHELYLPHFKRVVDEGVASVMSSYNSVNGEWAGQNYTLLTEILKEMWGFEGFVVTDWILGMRDAYKAAMAGQDLEMPFRMHFWQHLRDLVAEGKVPVERIDDAALRMIRQQVRFGQGRDPKVYAPEVVGCEEHRALARTVAQESIVLLKNEGDLLPLSEGQRVAVLGRLADLPNTGDRGSSNTRPAYVITPLQGLRAALGDDAVIHDDGSDLERAAEAARQADVALVVVGYTHEDEGEYIPPDMLSKMPELLPPPTPKEMPIAQRMAEMAQARQANAGAADAGAALAGQNLGYSPGGDRASLELRPDDVALINAVAEANPNAIVVLMASSAVIIEGWKDTVPAILMLWYPGMEGGHALADIVLGKVNPSGKLPFVMAKRDEDLPYFDIDATKITYDLWHGHRKLERDGVEPAYPFGFGLSYTSFAYSDLRIERDPLGNADTLRATVTVTNTGDRPGDEVVQLYVAALESNVERAPKELKAFARISLAPGESRSIELAVPAANLAYYEPGQGWVVESGRYQTIVGRHSLDPDALRAEFTIA